jgi:hypothetical protein
VPTGGAFQAAWDGRQLHVRPHADDPDPNPLIDNLPGLVRHAARVARPMVRARLAGRMARDPTTGAARDGSCR